MGEAGNSISAFYNLHFPDCLGVWISLYIYIYLFSFVYLLLWLGYSYPLSKSTEAKVFFYPFIFLTKYVNFLICIKKFLHFYSSWFNFFILKHIMVYGGLFLGGVVIFAEFMYFKFTQIYRCFSLLFLVFASQVEKPPIKL